MSENYRKRIPWGTLTVDAGGGYAVTDDKTQPGLTSIVNESQTLSDTITTFLNNPNVVVSTRGRHEHRRNHHVSSQRGLQARSARDADRNPAPSHRRHRQWNHRVRELSVPERAADQVRDAGLARAGDPGPFQPSLAVRQPAVAWRTPCCPAPIWGNCRTWKRRSSARPSAGIRRRSRPSTRSTTAPCRPTPRIWCLST